MKATLSKHHGDIAAITSTKSARYSTAGVHVESEKDGACLTATNGKTLLRIRHECETEGEGVSYIDAKSLKTALANQNKRAKGEVKLKGDTSILEVEDNEVRLLKRPTSSEEVEILPTIDGQSPPYNAVIPVLEGEPDIVVDPKLMAELLLVIAKQPTYGESVIEIRFNGPDKPCRIDLKNGEDKVVGVLMPMT